VTEHELGPHELLIAAAVRLARRDLNHPVYRHQARAFLRGEPFGGNPPGIDLRLFARLLGFQGSWETT